ncbi:MAG: hypothetical protein JOY78_17580 [Pseudonocardia sp.]|nr:hypothetical protein [Pseudonocardia sp.]
MRYCGYNSGRDVSGVFSANYGCDRCPYAESIPPAQPYVTRAAQDVLTSTTVQEMEAYVRRARQHGGGWVQLVFHQICNLCDLYSVSPARFKAVVEWLAAEQRRGAIAVATVRQVIGGPVKPSVEGPGSSPPPTSNLVSNPWLRSWGPVTIGGEPVSTTTAPLCFEAQHYGANNITLTRVSDGPSSAPTASAARLRVSGYASGAAELITSQIDLGACHPTLNPDRNYRLTAWYRSSAPAFLVVYAGSPGAGWRYWTQGPSLPATTTWRQATAVSQPLPRGADALSFGIALKSNGTLALDGYTMTPTAASPTLGNNSGQSLSGMLLVVAGPLVAIVVFIAVDLDTRYRRRRRHQPPNATRRVESR